MLKCSKQGDANNTFSQNDAIYSDDILEIPSLSTETAVGDYLFCADYNRVSFTSISCHWSHKTSGSYTKVASYDMASVSLERMQESGLWF